MSSNLVIKVKYGDTLRRFSVRLHCDGSLDLDMNGMRAKIINLFKLSADADFSLTYVDEDNDVVTLVDDDDLLDAVRQCLNHPLRINVLISSARTGRSDTRSSGTTPTSLPQIPSHPMSLVNSSVIEVLNCVPEPLLNALIKLPYDLASKAASSAPGFLPEPFDALLKHSHNLVSKAGSSGSLPGELFECLVKLGISPQAPSKCEDGVTSSTKDNDSDSSKSHNVSVIPRTSNDPAASPNLKAPIDNPTVYKNHNVNVVAKASNDPAASPNLKAPIDKPTVCDNGNMTRGVATPIPPANATLPKDSNGSGLSTGDNPVILDMRSNDRGKKLQKEYAGQFTGNSTAPETSILTFTGNSLPETSIPTSLADPPVGLHIQPPHTSKEAFVPPADRRDFFAVKGDNQKKNLSSIEDSSGLPDVLTIHNGCPSSSRMGAGSSIRFNNTHKIKRGNSHFKCMGGTFHRGVRCDGCGVYPITGPRYKSLVKEDYDLCTICYSEMGTDGQYTRMNHPVHHRSPQLFKELYDPLRHPRSRRTSSHRGRPGVDVIDGTSMRSIQPKLDSCFICDVNIIDGTWMPPKASFTKIWRMCNNGTMAWPKGTQLVWIGGDELTGRLSSVEVEIPSDGFPVDKEISIAVECIAPEIPGQYISYWRLALPSGYKFGQCVWVIIQVEGSHNHFSPSFNSWNLNLLPEESETKAPFIDVNVEPVDVSHPGFISNMGTELVKPMVDGRVGNDQELNLNGESVSVTPVNPEAVSYPLIDLSAVPSDTSSLINNVAEVSGNIGDNTMVVQSLLRELDEMGFKQIDLNKEILRMNEYSLELSVDDLCGFSDEWDPLLQELQEMGFHDKQTNTKLLIKNAGSIKRVVMDLITGEKA